MSILDNKAIKFQNIEVIVLENWMIWVNPWVEEVEYVVEIECKS